MKLRAVNEGRKLKDLAAELLERGLEAPEPAEAARSASIEIQADGLPVVRCARDAPATRMSTRDLLALEQDALAGEDLRRSGHAL